MLLKQPVLAGIADGTITLAFRRWKRPTVKAGGSLRTAMGVLAIESVEEINLDQITMRDARQAGYASRCELLAELQTRPEGKFYRIALHYERPDPRDELQQKDDLPDSELNDVRNRLSKIDARSTSGPWTQSTLQLIATRPGQRAAELAQLLGMDARRFKMNVRKLKELGLTESLKVGYRLSPRGTVVLRRLA